MRRRDQINVVGAFFLEVKKNRGETVKGNFKTAVSQSDFVILTEDTFQIAAGEENGAGTGNTRNAGLFPIVKPCPGGGDHVGLPTEAGLSDDSVRMAAAGTESAIFHGGVDPFEF